MLTKMWMGLYLSLVQVVFYIIVVINHDSKYGLQHSSEACVCIDSSINLIVITLKMCAYNIRFKLPRNNTCGTTDNPVDNTYLWFIYSSAPQWSLLSACLYDSV